MAGAGRDWYNAKHQDGNLYQGYMGGTTAIALGLALSLPRRRVVSLDGDGSMLMDLTILPVIAAKNPSNLVVIVFDNELYETVPPGNIPTFTAGATDLAKIAQGAGIQNSRLVTELSQFQEAIDEAFQANGASFILAKTKPSREPLPYPAQDGIETRYRFIRYIEKTENIQIIKPLGVMRKVATKLKGKQQ